MCEICDAFLKPIDVITPDRYHDLVERAKAAIADGQLECVDSTISLDLIERGHAVPPFRKHTFACARCCQLFILSVGGGDVVGDQWRPLHGN
jgi:hypothetical protein